MLARLRTMSAGGTLRRVGATVRYEGSAPPYLGQDDDPRAAFIAAAQPLTP